MSVRNLNASGASFLQGVAHAAGMPSPAALHAALQSRPPHIPNAANKDRLLRGHTHGSAGEHPGATLDIPLLSGFESAHQVSCAVGHAGVTGMLLHGNAIGPAILVIARPPVRARRPLCVGAPSRRRMRRRRCMLGPLGPAVTRLRRHIGSLAVIAFSPVVTRWLLCCMGARSGGPTRRKTLVSVTCGTCSRQEAGRGRAGR